METVLSDFDETEKGEAVQSGIARKLLSGVKQKLQNGRPEYIF